MQSSRFDFRALLNWELRKGSHKWPDAIIGGTCILEAAIIASGWPEYVPINHYEDVPRQLNFSTTMSRMLFTINDFLTDRDRQILVPFITRLPGSKGDRAVGHARDELIARRTVQEVLPILLDALKMPAAARTCRDYRGEINVATLDRVTKALHSLGTVAGHWDDPISNALEIIGTTLLVERNAGPSRKALILVADIVRTAFNIGPQAKLVPLAVANKRLEIARKKPAPKPASSRPWKRIPVTADDILACEPEAAT